MDVSINELRAWARASRDTAEREGFPRVAGAIGVFIDEMNAWLEAGHGYVTIEPRASRTLSVGPVPSETLVALRQLLDHLEREAAEDAAHDRAMAGKDFTVLNCQACGYYHPADTGDCRR